MIHRMTQAEYNASVRAEMELLKKVLTMNGWYSGSEKQDFTQFSVDDDITLPDYKNCLNMPEKKPIHAEINKVSETSVFQRRLEIIEF